MNGSRRAQARRRRRCGAGLWRRTPLPLQPPERSPRTASVPASATGSRWRDSKLLARPSRGRPGTAPIPPRAATSSAESPERNCRIARCAVRRGIPAHFTHGNHSPHSTLPSSSASRAPILMKAAMDARRVRVCSRQCRRVRSARPARRSSGTGIDTAPGEHRHGTGRLRVPDDRPDAHRENSPASTCAHAFGARARGPVRVEGARHKRHARCALGAGGGRRRW